MNLLFRLFTDHHIHDFLLVTFIYGLRLPVEVDITPIPDFSIVILIRYGLDGMANKKHQTGDESRYGTPTWS